MSIVLRPHHLLCTQGYSGKGYDNDFVAHICYAFHIGNATRTKLFMHNASTIPKQHFCTSFLLDITSQMLIGCPNNLFTQTI